MLVSEFGVTGKPSLEEGSVVYTSKEALCRLADKEKGRTEDIWPLTGNTSTPKSKRRDQV